MTDGFVQALVREAGETYAEEAGIKLKDQPAPTFGFLVLTNLLSARISVSIAVAAARKLFAADGGTASGMIGLSWQERIDTRGVHALLLECAARLDG